MALSSAAYGEACVADTGVASADGIKHNQTLQSFELNAWGTSMDNETGVALADGMKHNQTLQSFTNCSGSSEAVASFSNCSGSASYRNQEPWKAKEGLEKVRKG